MQADENSKSGNRLQPASLLKIIPDNLLLVNMTPVDGENAVMLQLREIGGKSATFEATSEKVKIRRVTACDVVGSPLVNGTLQFKPWENKFVKIEF